MLLNADARHETLQKFTALTLISNLGYYILMAELILQLIS